jgi:hypothetical protein
MMPLCLCCQSEPIAHSVYTASEGMQHLCNRCFLKLDTRLFEWRKADAKKAIQLEYEQERLKREYEIEKLKYWWNLSEDNGVGR